MLGEKSRYNVLKIGRRWGKTTLAINDLLPQVGLDGMPCAYYAPTYKDLNDVWHGVIWFERYTCLGAILLESYFSFYGSKHGFRCQKML